MRVVQLEVFKKEILDFPSESREDIFSIIAKFLKGEQLTRKEFKTFKIDKKTKIQEFRVKDHRGNWRAISTIIKGEYLVFVYAFHKKSQELLEKDKEIIRGRIGRIEL